MFLLPIYHPCCVAEVCDVCMCVARLRCCVLLDLGLAFMLALIAGRVWNDVARFSSHLCCAARPRFEEFRGQTIEILHSLQKSIAVFREVADLVVVSLMLCDQLSHTIILRHDVGLSCVAPIYWKLKFHLVRELLSRLERVGFLIVAPGIRAVLATKIKVEDKLSDF